MQLQSSVEASMQLQSSVDEALLAVKNSSSLDMGDSPFFKDNVSRIGLLPFLVKGKRLKEKYIRGNYNLYLVAQVKLTRKISQLLMMQQ